MTAAEVIDQHHPSMTDEDETVIDGLRYNSDTDRFGQPTIESADLAVRTCRCGRKIDGFDEYVIHIKEELQRAGL